jgi:TRAP-type C4-dicarboxylate transport system permease small subunit
MLAAHRIVAVLVLAACTAGALWGGLLYWRRRGAGQITAHLLSIAQTLLVAQVGLGLLLLSDHRRAADRLHYLYGSLALGAALAPWFYAPAEGPKRLLWFSGLTGLAGLLAVRAYMTAT